MRGPLREKLTCDRFVPLTRDQHNPFSRAPERPEQPPHLVDLAKNNVTVPEIRIFPRRLIAPKRVITQTAESPTADRFYAHAKINWPPDIVATYCSAIG